MPPPPNARLTAADSSALDGWIGKGAPHSADVCTNSAPAPGSKAPTLNCTPDQKVRAPVKYKLASGKLDTYVCYGFDVENTVGKRQIIAGAPFIDNTRLVHHVILFQTDEAVSPTPGECSMGGSSGRFIAGWAPGGTAMELPKEAGSPQEKGTTHYMIQVHYNNAQALLDQEDQTGFDLCTTDKLRPNDADVMATGTVKIDIPAHSTHEVTCDYEWPAENGPIHVIGAAPHMHRLGRMERAVLLPTGGAEQMLLDVPHFDFSNGGGGSPANAEVKAGDKLRTTCQWQNAGDTAVKLGEGTGDEMCFNFMVYYPKITSSKWKWTNAAVMPSLKKAGCTVTTK